MTDPTDRRGFDTARRSRHERTGWRSDGTVWQPQIMCALDIGTWPHAITTDRLTLRPMGAGDRQAIIVLLTNADAYRHLGGGHTIEQAETGCNRHMARSRARSTSSSRSRVT